MTDPEMTKLCAKAMDVDPAWPWRPLHDDAQAMTLVKKHQLRVHPPEINGSPRWWVLNNEETHGAESDDLNRAIVKCVAKMQAAKSVAVQNRS
jgi:hypothetical protein